MFDCKSISAANSPPVHIDTYNPKKFRLPSRVGARLIEAAVLAHGDPCERLKRRKDTDDITSTRQPLNFTPAGDGSSLQLLSRSHPVTLVDPRKIVLFQRPSFSAHSIREIDEASTIEPRAPILKTPRREPITRWKTSCLDYKEVDNARKRKAVPKAGLRQGIQPSTRIPLHFIPLEMAEKSYLSKSRKTSK